MATVGYLLSPLSWWNDLYVNVPVAYMFAWLVSFFDRRLFGVSLVFFYWITNLAGLLLLHKGLYSIAKGESEGGRSVKSLLFDVVLSVVYSGILVLLVHAGTLRLPCDYFRQ